jgi:cysteine synthase A
VLETVGDTPCIRVNDIAPKSVRIYVKAEAFNPAASVKDRLALNIIEAAERNGTLKPGQTVVEATSGNTGSATMPYLFILFLAVGLLVMTIVAGRL